MSIPGAAQSGILQAQSTFEKAADRISSAAAREPSATDLSADMVAMLQARTQFQSTARVIQTVDEMQKRLIDVWA